MERKNKLTNGNITTGLVRFAIPLLLGSMLQQMYGMADILFVSRCLGTKASAAVGASSTIVTCLIGLFTGISMGAGVIIGNYRGAQKKKEEKSSMKAALYISIVGGLAIMLGGLAMSRQILEWMETPKEILELALVYIRIYFLAIPMMILYNISAAVFQALGDSKRPVLMLALGGALNVGCNALLIVVIPLGVVGAGVATLISQGISALLLCYSLIKQEKLMEVRGEPFQVYIPKILKIGVPAGIQAVILTLSNLFVQYHINIIGEDAVAAFTIYYKIENFIYMPIVAFGQAMLVFTSQNMGAGNPKRVWKGMRTCYVISGLTTIVLSFGFIVLSKEMMCVFTKDNAVVEAGSRIMHIIFPWYIIYSMMEVTSAFIRGIGKTGSAMLLSMLFLCGSRVLFLQMFSSWFKGIEGVATIYPVTWILALLAYGTYSFWLKKEIR